MERRPGRATARLRDALDGPLDTNTPLAPEAHARAKASRKRYAGRRPQSALDDGTEEILLFVGAVVLLLVSLFLVGLVVTS